ncbi:MAG: hypothetical protein H6502_00335 [Candidatus Woesearchaeota archaeon]|nr:MAG: hypothetical protein H6502_00335 [Candidatus Woesearchaeota archaeon]
MSLTFKKYLSYLQDNPKGYWFKRKLFGWGWTPATWQGWLILLLFVVYAFVVARKFAFQQNSSVFLSYLFLGVALLIIVAYVKGEKPRWQWGLR